MHPDPTPVCLISPWPYVFSAPSHVYTSLCAIGAGPPHCGPDLRLPGLCRLPLLRLSLLAPVCCLSGRRACSPAFHALKTP